MNKLILVAAISVLLFTAIVLTHDVSAKKKHKKCVVFEDGSHLGDCKKSDLKPWNCHKQGNKRCGKQ